MSIRELLKKYSKIEIELLLAFVLKKPKEFVFLHPEKNLSAYQLKRLLALVKRRLKGEPIAYILGYKDFYGLRFKVTKDVLIPRPETEELVARAVLGIKNKVLRGKQIRILDLGTGSGAIIVSIARELKNLPSPLSPQLYGSDISKKALAIAKQNAKTNLEFYYRTSKYESKIQFIQSDLFENITGKFDIIVANLPYVPVSSIPLLAKEGWLQSRRGGTWEPKLALTDGSNDFEIYERFFQELSESKITNQKSSIYLELDPTAVPYIKKWVKKYLPDWQVAFHKDIHGLWRFAEIKSSL